MLREQNKIYPYNSNQRVPMISGQSMGKLAFDPEASFFPEEPKRKKRKLFPRLPQEILVLGNRDKGYHEEWYQGRDLLDIPHPFRMVLASKPNGGKTTIIKNVILRVAQGRDPFERIIVVHCDEEETEEYVDLDCIMLSNIPAIKDLQSEKKTLIILEDLNYLSMGRDEKGCLERLFGYASTHKNISCMLTAQDPFRIMATVRRCSNIFVIWHNHDMMMIKTLAQRLTNISSDQLCALFEEKCKTNHDSLWIDLTDMTPAPFRKNGYEVFSL